MKVEARLEFEKVRHDKDVDAHLIVSITAPEPNAEAKRSPLAIIVCIDRSGSMQGAKLEYAKRSAIKMVDHLKSDDYFGVVVFDDEARTVAKTEKLEGRKEELKAAIGKIQTGGGTNFASGMMKSIDTLKKLDLPINVLHRVIMFTDGHPTTGPAVDPKGIIRILEANMDRITVSVFGYGRDVNHDFLDEFSKKGKGNYAFISDPDKALAAFGKELGGLLSTYATDIEIEVSALSGHEVRRVISDVAAEEEVTGELSVKVPDLLAEETRHLVFDVKLAAQKQTFPRAVNVFDVKVTHDMFGEDGKKDHKSFEAKAKVQFVKADEADKKPDPELDKIIGIAEIVRAQIEAEKKASTGDYVAAAAVMQNASASLGSRGHANLASIGHNMSARVGSASLFAASAGYRKSFQRGATRGVGTSEYDSEAFADLQEIGDVQFATSTQTSTSGSFTGGSVLNQPQPGGAVDIGVSAASPPAGAQWAFGGSVLSGSISSGNNPPSSFQIPVATSPSPVIATPPTNEQPDEKSSKPARKPLKQTKSNTRW